MGVHDEAVATLRAKRGIALEAERYDNPHCHHRHEVHHNTMRQEAIQHQARALQNLRTAGKESINPRMGTCGSLPDLRSLRGREGNDAWRASTPWAIDGP